jgi:AcrR family transcriptional regulator
LPKWFAGRDHTGSPGGKRQQGPLFRHFKSKDDLLEALSILCCQATERSLPDDPWIRRPELVAWCRAHHRELYKVRALIRRSMGEFRTRTTTRNAGIIRIANDLSGYRPPFAKASPR